MEAENPAYSNEVEVPDDKAIYPMELDDASGFDFQRKIASVQSEKTNIVIIIALVVIIFLLIILLGVCGATAHHVYTTTPASTDCTASTPATSSPVQSGSGNNSTDQDRLNRHNELVSAIQNVTDLVNSQLMYTASNGDSIGQLMNSTTQSLASIVNTLSNLGDTGTSTAGVVDDILLVVNNILTIQNGSQIFNTFKHISCSDVYNALPNSPSGYYHLNSKTVYCNMDQLCNVTGGWTRLAYFDMTDATTNCPPGFRLYQQSGVRACGRPGNTASCVSQGFDPNGISYSQICGRVTGYQYATTDAFHGGGSLDSYYIEGVSITYGSPRTHVWSLAAGPRDTFASGGGYDCPCNTGSPQPVPSFVGSNYFCESGNPNPNIGGYMYLNDPLWDGQGCGTMEQACCAAPGLPWFYRNFGNVNITDSVELRVCGDQSPGNEDSPISFYEIYVK